MSTLTTNIAPYPSSSGSSPLRAFTAAALALPGMTPVATLAATDDTFDLQYGFYQEGQRLQFDGFGNPNLVGRRQLDPIRNDNLHASGGVHLTDRLKLTAEFVQDSWSGATPITTAPYVSFNAFCNALSGASTHGSCAPPYIRTGTSYQVDKDLNPYREIVDVLTGQRNVIKDTRILHMLASASPETRKQGNFSLAYEWDEAAFSVGGGLSSEADYESHALNASGRLDFNQKQTTLNLGLGYTGSDIAARQDEHALTYIDYTYYLDAAHGPAIRDERSPGELRQDRVFRGERRDWTANLGLTQVVNQNALFDSALTYTRGSGFLTNPYKAVSFIFIDPAQPLDSDTGLFTADLQPVQEKRPDIRNQWSWRGRWIQYYPQWDAATHLSYSFYSDDWGIDAHTFEADWAQPLGDGWTVTPRIRYYSQSAADFYQPFFVFRQARPINSNLPGNSVDFNRVPVSNYSSDHRLSGFGTLSGGLTLNKTFARGAATLEAGVEYYTHEGSLKLGGGGEANYADFDSFLMTVGLRVNLSPHLMATVAAASTTHSVLQDEHADHAAQAHPDHMMYGPAGIIADHMLHQAGDFMFGYRYMYSHHSGQTLQGSTAVNDAMIAAQGCGAKRCTFTSSDMSMHMHMLDFMYAPTDGLTLMLMPQIMDMTMDLRQLEGVVPDTTSAHHHGSGGHTTGGISDTRAYALVRLFDTNSHHMHVGLGVSAPTGDVGQLLSDGSLLHYHMQLGSGTWDFLPSLTYSGHWQGLGWGAQVNGIKRLEEANASGFLLGDLFQATSWVGYQWNNWITTTLRGVYTTQDRIRGGYRARHSESSPPDLPLNYGGQFWEVGLGLSAKVPYGQFQGNQVSIEWLQPVSDNVLGVQLERDGALSATWSLMF